MVLDTGENYGEQDRDTHSDRAESAQATELVQRPWQADEKAYNGGYGAEGDSAFSRIAERVEQLGPNLTMQGYTVEAQPHVGHHRLLNQRSC